MTCDTDAVLYQYSTLVCDVIAVIMMCTCDDTFSVQATTRIAGCECVRWGIVSDKETVLSNRPSSLQTR